MAEIYTGDFSSLADVYSRILNTKLGFNFGNQDVDDAFSDFQMQLRKLIYDRMAEQFEKIIVDLNENKDIDDLRNQLFKIINEL